MLTEKAGANAGLIWNALDGKEGLTFKEIKKETKQKKDDFLLGLGWLLREGKIAAVEVEEAEKFNPTKTGGGVFVFFGTTSIVSK